MPVYALKQQTAEQFLLVKLSSDLLILCLCAENLVKISSRSERKLHSSLQTELLNTEIHWPIARTKNLKSAVAVTLLI